jgi:hypothetical protein
MPELREMTAEESEVCRLFVYFVSTGHYPAASTALSELWGEE